MSEQRGILDSAQLSLARCLKNMWLKATAIGLALQLLSITERMADWESYELIVIPLGEHALNGLGTDYCIVRTRFG